MHEGRAGVRKEYIVQQTVNRAIITPCTNTPPPPGTGYDIVVPFYSRCCHEHEQIKGHKNAKRHRKTIAMPPSTTGGDLRHHAVHGDTRLRERERVRPEIDFGGMVRI